MRFRSTPPSHRFRHPGRIARPVAALVAAALVAGCGGGEGDAIQTAGSPAAQSVTIAADPSGELRWVQERTLAAPGEVKITMVNRSSVPHNLTVRGTGVEAATETVERASRSIRVRLAPGEYTYVCTVPGHETMQGTLVVGSRPVDDR